DLVERQSQLFERQNAIEARQLVGGVIAVARPPINMLRLEQIDIVVVAQQATRNLGDFRELTNFEHISLATRAAPRGGAPLRAALLSTSACPSVVSAAGHDDHSTPSPHA